MQRHLGIGWALVVAAAALCACAPHNIPGTSIRDTHEDRAIMQVVANYETAYEAKDAGGILRLVSPHFYETNGTPDPSDDYDYKGLKAMLETQFKQIESPTLTIDVRKVAVKGEVALVDYYFTARFQLAHAGPNGGFKSSSDVAQIKLEHEATGWKIVSGI